MIPPHLFDQIYHSFLEKNYCTPSKCGDLSKYTDSTHTEVEDLSSRCMNGSDAYDRCGYDTRPKSYIPSTRPSGQMCSFTQVAAYYRLGMATLLILLCMLITDRAWNVCHWSCL